MSTGRNEPCPCGSGRKYKRCCLAAEEAATAQAPGSARVRERLFEEHGFPWVAYLLTGFAPREFLRLDPR